MFVKEAQIQIAKKIKKIEDPNEKLYTYIVSWNDIMDEDFLDYADIMLDIWAESVRLHQGKDVFGLNRMYRTYRKQISEILKEGIEKEVFKPVDVTVVSAIIIGTMDGIMIQWLLDRNIFKIKPALEQLAELIVSGMRKTN